MKKLIWFVLICAISTAVNAQINPDERPTALDPKPIQIGEYHSFIADNGMEVFLVRKVGYPKFRISVQFNVPTLGEEQQPEVRKVLSAILNDGSANYSKAEIKKITEQYSATSSGSINNIVCSGMKRDLNILIPILSSFVNNPAITQTAIDTLVKEKISELEAHKEKPDFNKHWIQKFQDSLSFSKIENADMKPATISGYKAITISDLTKYFKTYISPNNSFCMITGDFTVDEAKALIHKNFKKWHQGTKYISTYQKSISTNLPQQRKLYIVDKPNAVQSKISVTWPLVDGFPYSDNEPVLMIMNQIYGDGFLSYLNRNLRGDKGLTYGVKNFLSLDITGGHCNTNLLVRTSETDYALENVLFEMLRIRNDKVNQTELDMAINGMLGDYARSMSQLNSPAIIGFGMVKSLYKLPDDYLKTYPLKIAKITADDVRKAAQQYVNPFKCNIVIEGDVKALKGKFEKFGPVEYFDSEGKKWND